MSNRRVRVLHVLTTSLGGIGTYVQRLLDAHDPQRFTCIVGFSSGNDQDDGLRHSASGWCEIPWRRGGDLASSWLAFVRLTRLIREGHFDVVVTHGSIAGAVGRLAAWRARCPVIIHTAHASARRAAKSPLQSLLYGLIERCLARFTTCTICVSAAMRGELLEGGSLRKQRSLVVRYSVDLPRMDLAIGGVEARARHRRELELDDAPTALAAGRFEPQKAFHILLACWPLVRRQVPNARLLLVGSGPLEPSLRNMTSEGVTFLGWRNDVPELCSASDVLIMPSAYEGLPILAMEAMAARIPVVATSVGGLPELVVDELTGRLVPASDVAALATAVSAVLGDMKLARRLGSAGRLRLEQHFSGDRIVAEHQRCYELLLEHRRAWRQPHSPITARNRQSGRRA